MSVPKADSRLTKDLKWRYCKRKTVRDGLKCLPNYEAQLRQTAAAGNARGRYIRRLEKTKGGS